MNLESASQMHDTQCKYCGRPQAVLSLKNLCTLIRVKQGFGEELTPSSKFNTLHYRFGWRPWSTDTISDGELFKAFSDINSLAVTHARFTATDIDLQMRLVLTSRLQGKLDTGGSSSSPSPSHWATGQGGT